VSLKVVEPIASDAADSRVETLGVILIASANKVFANAIGHLVTEGGFTPSFPVGLEAPWISVTRTQPCVVICDHDAPVKRQRRMIADVSARRVPLLMLHTEEKHTTPPALARVERVTWQRIPVSADELRRLLVSLMPPDRDRGGPPEAEPAEDSGNEYPLEGAESADQPPIV
jgi:hypothetical protein